MLGLRFAGGNPAAMAPPAALVPGAPDVPESLSATTVDDRSLDVTWSAPSGGEAVVSYDLRWRQASGSWTTVNTVTSPHDLNDLPMGGAVTDVQVRAVNGAGAGDWSASDSDTTHVRPYGLTAEWNLPISAISSRDPHPHEDYMADRLFNFWLNPGWMNFFDRDYTYAVYSANDATESALVNDTNNWGNLDGENIPWNPSWTIPSGSDKQVIVIDPETGEEWNLWRASYASSVVTIQNGNLIPGDYRTKTDGFGGSRGVGIQYLMGLVTPEEIAQGKIYHALSMPTKHPGYSLYASPGTKGEEYTGNEDNLGIPQGTRFYLDKSESEIDAHIATFSAGVTTATKDTLKIVFMAMKEYGWIITDNSGANHIQFQHDASCDWTPYGFDEYTDGGKTWPRDAMDGLVTDSAQIKAIMPPDAVLYHEETGANVAPLSLATPVITGSTTLSVATPGNFWGEATVTITKNWQKDTGSGFADISGATSDTFDAATEGAGDYRIRYTGTNSNGTATSYSNEVTVAGSYSVQWVTADGNDDMYYSSSVGSDSTLANVAFLVRDTDATAGDGFVIFSIWGRASVELTNDNLLRVQFKDTSNGNLLEWNSNASVRASGESLFCVSMDSTAGTVTATRNGSSIAGTYTYNNTGTMDLTRNVYSIASNHAAGNSTPTAGSLWIGDIGWVHVEFGANRSYSDFYSSGYLDPAGVGTAVFCASGSVAQWNAGTHFGTAGSGAMSGVNGTFS